METTARTSKSTQMAVPKLHADLSYFSGNDVLAFELEAGGTEFQASGDSRSAFETLWDGNQWMIYRNIFTNTLHWDFVSIALHFNLTLVLNKASQSVLGRFITFPVADNQ